MLTNVELVERELRQTLSRGATKDAIDRQACLDAIDRVVDDLQNDTLIKRWFAPWYGTKYFDLISVSKGGLISGTVLFLADDLLSMTSLTQNEESVADADRILLPKGNLATNRIKLINNEVWALSATYPEDGIEIVGEWAYHHRPSDRWKDTGSTLQVTVNETATSISVDDADGASWRGDTPRFSPGQLIKIGSEYMSVRAVTLGTDPSPDVLTVIRGMQGSTAAAHTAGSSTIVYVWNPIAEAERFATRAATLDYRRRAQFITTQVEGVTEQVWPTRQTMPEYKRLMQIPRRLPMKVRAI